MSYISDSLSPTKLTRIVNRTVAKIISTKIHYDALLIRGTSGALIAGALAVKLHKPIIMIRKENQHAHSTSTIEFPECWNISTPGLRLMFIDDGISSGATINACIDTLKTDTSVAKIVGAVMYNQNVINSGAVVRDWAKHRWDFEIFYVD